MFERFKGFAKNMVFYLPRTSDLQQIAECVGKDEKAQISGELGRRPPWVKMKQITKARGAKACTAIIPIMCTT
jgi:hypothetical protein